MGAKKYIIGNWKMNLNVHEASLFVAKLASDVPIKRNVETVICPSFMALQPISLQINHRQLKLGAQDCYWRDEGAFTGEVSASQLKGLAQYVIVGHSERRYVFAENDRDIRFKVQAALRNKLRPILCVGETEQEYSAHDTEHMIRDQVASGLMNVKSNELDQVLIAYEPVWAVGSSAPATIDIISEEIKLIRNQVNNMFGAKAARTIPVLYGGSTTLSNSAEILHIEGLDGLLVGRSSLIASEFAGLVELAGKTS